jgi:hypothetical protein
MLNWPFECETPDGRKHFNFEHWEVFYRQKNREYPCPEGHHRYILDLLFPSEKLEDVWVHWSPFGTEEDPKKGSHDINFKSGQWSTIWDVYPNHMRHGDLNFDEDTECKHSCRIIIEDNHPEPWGEPITLLSTAKSWADNHATRFVYFRGKYWKTHMPLLMSNPAPKNYFSEFSPIVTSLDKHMDDVFAIEDMFNRINKASDN